MRIIICYMVLGQNTSMATHDSAGTGAKSIGGPEPAGFPTPQQFFAVLLGFFALHVLGRVLISGCTDLDESEQLVLTQKFRWGYGSQPPLYTWIQMAFFGLFSVSVFSLSLFKNLLLFCTYGLTYVNTRLITRSHRLAMAATISLLFIPQVAWESQRDLTHSVLSATLAVATLHCFLRVCLGGRTAWYLGFGLCAGVGLLSKYNYVFWALGLLLAGVSVREFRAAVFNWRMLAALLIGLLIFLPNGLWILDHRDLAFMTSGKLGLNKPDGWIANTALGFRHLLVAVASFLGPLALVYFLILFKSSKQPDDPRPGAASGKLLSRTLLSIGVMLVLLVLVFRATNIRERWLQPILVSTPVLAVVLLRDRLDATRLKRIIGAGLAVMCVVLVLLPGRVLLAERINREERLNRPYDSLAAHLRPAVPEGSAVVTDTRLLGGNLRLHLPGRLFVTSDLAGLFQAGSEHCFLAWDATRSDEPPESLRDWAQGVAPAELDRHQPRFFSATYNYKYHRSKQLRLGLLQIK